MLERSIAVHFSPNGGITAADVAAIDAAKSVILVHAYDFTSRAIAAALLAAKQRGVQVQVVIDQQCSEAKSCLVSELSEAGCPVNVAECAGLAHSKILLIDGQTVITGSFNWSEAAEVSNQENQLILSGVPDLVAAYLANWHRCFDAGTPYKPGEEP